MTGMKRGFKQSLLTQLVSYFSLLSLVSLSIVAVGSYFQARHSLEREVVDRLTVATQLKSSQLKKWVEVQLRDILLVSQDTVIKQKVAILLTADPAQPSYHKAYRELQSYIAYVTRIKPNLRSIRITRNSGFVVFASDMPGLEGTYRPLGDPATYFTSDRLNTVVPNFYIPDKTKKVTITVATPILDDKNFKIAAFTADLALHDIDALIRDNTGLGETAETYLIGRAGTRTVFLSGQMMGSPDTKAGTAGVRSPAIDRAISQQSGFGSYPNYAQVPVVGVYRWLPEQNLALIAEMSQAKAFDPANRLAHNILLLGSLSSGVLLVAIYLLSRKIIRPILAINATAARLAEGDLTQKAPIMTEDEVGVLAQTFNNMAKQLRSSFESLEQRVEERTQELTIAKAMADSANRAKSDFLAHMSHELRTPLNGILGYAQILQRSHSWGEKEARGVNIIYQCGSHLLTLINDVLDLSKIEANKLELSPQPTHLPSLLQSVIEICRVRAEGKGLVFRYQAAVDLVEGVEVDEIRLRQVLINLLGNAIKFTDRGSVTLIVEQVETGLAAGTPLVKLCFQVKDTGVGIAADRLEAIFQPFTQVGDRQRQQEGTGLGLAISRRMINLMGSDLEVTSELGQGSTFFFEIEVPLVPHWNTQSWFSLEQPVIGYEGEPKTILVIDDQWENRSVLVNLLEPLGFHMIEAENGLEGLAKATTHPDLVITDLAMPGMDGLAFLRQLRASKSIQHLKVIVSSASVAERDRQVSLDAGGDGFIAKPIKLGELLQHLQSQLNVTWKYANQSLATSLPSSQDNPVFSLEEPSLTAGLIPDAADLRHLLDLSEQGLMMKFQEEARRIEQTNPAYRVFSQKAIHLAQTFQIDALEQWLREHI